MAEQFQGPAFAGLYNLLHSASEASPPEDIEDDIEGEQETLPDLRPEGIDIGKSNREFPLWRHVLATRYFPLSAFRTYFTFIFVSCPWTW